MTRTLLTKPQIAKLLPIAFDHRENTSRKSAPAFSRGTLRNLRRLSGLTRPAKVLNWWRGELRTLYLNMSPAPQSPTVAAFLSRTFTPANRLLVKSRGENRRNVG